MQTKYRNFLCKNIYRSFASWEKGEAVTTLTINVVAFLLSYVVSEFASEKWQLSTTSKTVVILVLWFVLLFTLVTPYRLWKEMAEENVALKNKLDVGAKRQNAMARLGQTWSEATDFLVAVAAQNKLSVDECVQLREFERAICDDVKIISPGELSTFQTMRRIDKNEHPVEYHEQNWGGDKTVLCFSERLARVQKFIDKHTPPVSGS